MDERTGAHEFAGSAVEHVERSRCGWPTAYLAPIPFPVQVGEYRNLRRVPIGAVARRELEIPFQFARVGIQRHYRATIKVIARANVRIIVRPRIGRTP